MSVTGSLGMFTIVPVRRHDVDARAALRWLPAVGLGLGAAAALPLVAITEWAPHATFAGAVVAVGGLALLTRGLHLDGLADTADGLGSGAPAQRALAIMKQSDIGPFGVITLVLVLLLDVASLVAITRTGTWAACAALAVAALTGRLAALHASSAPPARPDGFGALVHGAATTTTIALETVAGLLVGAGLAVAVGASWWRWPLVQLIALTAAAGLRVHTTRRFGGTTGDVFGAVVETATVITLLGSALS